MTRAAVALALATLTGAPMQCAHPPEDSVRTEDSAGDAMWALAQDFEAHGEHAAAVHTLDTLARRYPANRHAQAARLAAASDAGP